MPRILAGGFFGASAVTLTSKGGCPLLQHYTGGVKQLHWRLITFRTRYYFIKDFITFRKVITFRPST